MCPLENERDEMSQTSEAEKEVTFADALENSRERLRRLVELRIDPRVRSRIDASDVIQETQIEACEREDEFHAQDVPVFVWLRYLALQKLSQLHRKHLGTKARDASREGFDSCSDCSLSDVRRVGSAIGWQTNDGQPSSRTCRSPTQARECTQQARPKRSRSIDAEAL